MFSLRPDGEKSIQIGVIDSGKYKGEKIFIERPEYPDPDACVVDLGKDCLSPFPIGRVTYISGPAGAGKSTMAAILLRNFLKLHKKSDIYMFSRKNAKEDPAYKGLNIIQVRLDSSLVEHPVSVDNIDDGSIVVFDDIGTITDKGIEDAVELLARDIMEVGRHKNIHIIVTTHITNDHKPLYKTLTVELHTFIFFPSAGALRPIVNFLERYFYYDKKEIKKILEINRNKEFAWTLVKRTTPQLLMHKHGCEFINHFLDDL